MHAGFDTDPVGTLTIALRIALDAPGAAWSELLADPAIDDDRAAALLRAEVPALDALFAELNELRSIGP